jgi:hypothetical protein
MSWLFSKNNTFAHEEPATINALMSASVEGTTASQTVFAHRHLYLLLAVSFPNCPSTLRNFWSLMPQSQVVIFVRRIVGPQYLYIIQMSALGSHVFAPSSQFLDVPIAAHRIHHTVFFFPS